jgi:hypothetical protein
MSRQRLYRKIVSMNPVQLSELALALGLSTSTNIDAIIEAYLKLSA